MERRRSLTTLELVMLAAVAAEVLIGRLLVRGLEKKPVFVRGVPQKIVPPTWFVALDYLALFLLYFVAMMGVIVLAVRARELALESGRGKLIERTHRVIGGASSAALAAVAAFATVVHPDAVVTLLHVALLAIAAHQLVRVWTAPSDVGAAIGLTLCAAPIVLYCGASLLSGSLWTEDQMLGGDAKAGLGRWARSALALAAVASPYTMAPRPFARSMTRVLPFAVALVVAGVGAAALRLEYFNTVRSVNNVLGLDLRVDAPQDQIALYLLAFATITWTVVACVTASSPARRRLGLGLALLVMAGYGFAWPAAFVTAALGLMLMADGAVKVRDEEQGAFLPVTPAIDDDVWQSFVTQTVSSLRRLVGSDTAVSAVSVRGEGEHTSTVVVTERHDVSVRLRVERMARAVVVIDVVCGREVDPGRPASWTAVARSGGLGGGHPEPPPSGPVVRTDDPPFDDRFRCRGDRELMNKLLDDGLRARAAASLDGWIAYWDGQSLRHRVFPGQGAPMDHPIPLSKLALDRRSVPENVERLVMVLELCAEIAARGLTSRDEPVALVGDLGEVGELT
jgi:hypothetical protein